MNAYETAGVADQPDGVRSDSPQSFVTSHQNEYRLLIRTARILRVQGVSAGGAGGSGSKETQG